MEKLFYFIKKKFIGWSEQFTRMGRWVFNADIYRQ